MFYTFRIEIGTDILDGLKNPQTVNTKIPFGFDFRIQDLSPTFIRLEPSGHSLEIDLAHASQQKCIVHEERQNGGKSRISLWLFLLLWTTVGHIAG